MIRRFGALLLAAVVLTGLAAPAALAHGSGSLPSRIDLPNGWAPEGITAGRGSTVFVGSLAARGIWKGDVQTGTGAVLPGTEGTVGVGVDYEFRHDRIWVAGGPTSLVHVFDATTGSKLKTYDLAPSGFLNDVVVTRHAAYVTDSNMQQLIVIPLGKGGALPDAAIKRPLTGELDYVDGQFNANGIVASGGWLILVQSFTGQLFRVNPWTGDTRLIDLHGATIPSGDGLEIRGRTLWAVTRGNAALGEPTGVALVRLNRRLTSGHVKGVITSTDFAVPTTVAKQDQRLWVVNARFGTPVTPDTAYWLTGLPTRP